MIFACFQIRQLNKIETDQTCAKLNQIIPQFFFFKSQPNEFFDSIKFHFKNYFIYETFKDTPKTLQAPLI